MGRAFGVRTVALSIVHKLRQRIFSRSNQIDDDAAEEEEVAVFPPAIGFAGLILTVFKMYGTGTERHCR